MATKITRQVLESFLLCKFKSYRNLAGEQGTTCEFSAMLTDLRAEVRLKAIDTIAARYPGNQVARNLPLTITSLKRGAEYILDVTLEDETLQLHFDGLKRTEGESKLGDFHYVPVLFHEGRQIKKVQKLLLEVYGEILSGLQGRTPAYGVVWHGLECKATRVKLRARRGHTYLCGDSVSKSIPRRVVGIAKNCRERSYARDGCSRPARAGRWPHFRFAGARPLFS